MKLMKSMTIRSLFVLLVSVVMLSSCSKKADYLNVIPENSIFVFSMDLPSIAKKGNLKEIDKLNSYATIKGLLQGELGSENLAFLEEIKNNPQKTGLSMSSDILIFAYGDIDNLKFSAVAELSSKKKFENFLTDAMDKLGEDLQIVDEFGLRVAVADDEPFMYWDDNKVVINESKSEANRLFHLPANEKLTTNEAFNKFYQNKKDMSLWMSFDYILESEDFLSQMQSSPEMEDFMANYQDMIKDSYMNLYLNFGKKDMTISFVMDMNEKLRELQKKHNVMAKVDSKLLNYLPKESYLAFSAAINMEEYMAMMDELGMGDMFDELDKELTEETDGVFTLDKLAKTLKGDAIASLHGVDDQFSIIPLFSFIVGLNDRAMLDDVMSTLPEGLILEQLNCYEISGLDFPIYFAYDDNALLISSDWNVASSFTEGGLKENLSSSPIAKSIKSYPSYVFLSLDYESYPNIIKEQAAGAAGIIKPFDDFFVNIEIVGEDNENGEMIINLEHKSANSLEGFLKLLDTSVLPLLMMAM